MGSLASLGVGGPPAASTSFTDNFNRSDRALNGDNGWAFVIGSSGFNIVSNELQIGSASGDNTQVNSSLSVANGFVQADIKLAAATATVGIVFRYQDANNFYLMDVDNSGGIEARYTFYKRQGGSYTSLASATGAAWLLNVYATIKVTFSGSNVTVFFNGASDFVTSDGTFSAAGPGGLRNGGGGSGNRTVDNFMVSQ